MKSELLMRALMSKMANGGNVGGDEPYSSAKKVTKIPKGYTPLLDSNGKPVTDSKGQQIYKRKTEKLEVEKKDPQVKSGEDSGDEKKPTPITAQGSKKSNTQQGKPKDWGKKRDPERTKVKPEETPTPQEDYVVLETETETEKEMPKTSWGKIFGGETRWSRASQGMPSIIDKSGKKFYFQAKEIPAVWDEKSQAWETSGGFGNPTTLYGAEIGGDIKVFDPTNFPVSYTKKGEPYYELEKMPELTGKYLKSSQQAIKEGPQKNLRSYGSAIDPTKIGEYDPSLDIQRGTNEAYEGIETYKRIQPKKKGGIVKRYENGGYVLRATNPGQLQDMNVSDTDLSGFTYKAPEAPKVKTGIEKSSGSKFLEEDGADAIGQIGELSGTGVDVLDRKDGRSSIAGQAASGALKGAGKGASIGATFGLPGMLIGGIAGGLIGGTTGAIRGKKERKERQQSITDQFSQNIEQKQKYDPLNPNPTFRAQGYNQRDFDTGLASLFSKGGQVKQMSNSVNKTNYAKGGTIKGAGTGTSDSIVTDINKKGIPEGSFITPAKNNEMAKGIRGMILGQNPNKVAEFKKGGTPKSDKVAVSNGEHLFTPAEKKKITTYLGKEILEKLAPEAEENEMEKNKGGEMIKRADGSYSKRGLWDNIRANAGSGKKPTAEMLKQEKEIKSELKKGGYVVKRSSERKGKTHVVIGPDGTKKYFGDSKLGQHPNDPTRKKAFYARHEKNLKKNPYFRAFARETWAEGGTVGSKMNKAKGGELTKSKAKEILHDKSVHGKPLTDKQRKYFGWVAGGKKNMGGIVGKYAMGGNVNRDWDWG